MSQSPGSAPRTLVLRLSVPAQGVLRSIAADIAGRVADYVGSRVPDPGELTAAVEAVFRTDLAIKTSAGDPRALLERLVVELCSRNSP